MSTHLSDIPVLCRDTSAPVLHSRGDVSFDAAMDRAVEARSTLLVNDWVAISGFQIATSDQFRALVEAVTGAPPSANHEARTGRAQVTEGVYTATDHPPTGEILLHSEKAHTSTVPRFVALFADRPADAFGGTILAKADDIARRLPPDLAEKFRTTEMVLERNYFGGAGLNFDWRRAFGVAEREPVEAYLAAREIKFRWMADDGLHTRWPVAAYVAPENDRRVHWCNAVLHYDPRCYLSEGRDPQRAARALRLTNSERRLPFDLTWPDGERLTEDQSLALLGAHRTARTSWRWRRGDVVIINNLAMMHGREPFVGDRRILVCMTGALERALSAAGHGISSLVASRSR